MSEHTPGPWNILCSESRGGPRCLVVCPKDNEIASINPYRESWNEDAELIARAPDLLAQTQQQAARIAELEAEVERLRGECKPWPPWPPEVASANDDWIPGDGGYPDCETADGPNHDPAKLDALLEGKPWPPKPFAVGDLVVCVKPHAELAVGKIHKVVDTNERGWPEIAEDCGYWNPEFFRHATPAEIEAAKLESQDWVVIEKPPMDYMIQEGYEFRYALDDDDWRPLDCVGKTLREYWGWTRPEPDFEIRFRRKTFDDLIAEVPAPEQQS